MRRASSDFTSASAAARAAAAASPCACASLRALHSKVQPIRCARGGARGVARGGARFPPLQPLFHQPLDRLRVAPRRDNVQRQPPPVPVPHVEARAEAEEALHGVAVAADSSPGQRRVPARVHAVKRRARADERVE